MTWKRSSVDGLTGVALVVAIALAGCSVAGGSPGTAATPSTGSSAAPSAGARTAAGTTASTPATSPAPAGATGAITDAAGDATPGYLDALRLRAVARSGHLDLVLTLAEPVPASSVGVGTLEYDFSLDTDGDGTPDAVATLERLPEGGYRPVLSDTATGHRLEGAEFPGTAGLTGAEVTVGLTLDAIGCPAVVAIRASSVRARGGVTTRDEIPETSADAVAVSTRC